MKQLSLTACLLLCFSVGFSQTIKKAKITEVEEYIKKSEHPIVVNFWATWCAPCIAELPDFMATIKKYDSAKVEFVMVSLDFASSFPNEILHTIRMHKLDATFFWLNETKADYFCPMVDPKWDGAIPSTLFVNNKANYRKFFGRPMTDRQIDLEVKRLIGLKSN